MKTVTFFFQSVIIEESPTSTANQGMLHIKTTTSMFIRTTECYRYMLGHTDKLKTHMTVTQTVLQK